VIIFIILFPCDQTLCLLRNYKGKTLKEEQVSRYFLGIQDLEVFKTENMHAFLYTKCKRIN